MNREKLLRMLTLKKYFKVIEIPEEDAIRQVYPKIYVYKIVKYKKKYTVIALFKLFVLICISHQSDKKSSVQIILILMLRNHKAYFH